MKRFLTILIFLFPVYLVAQNNADSTYKPVEYPEGFSALLNVTYTKVNEWEGISQYYLQQS